MTLFQIKFLLCICFFTVALKGTRAQETGTALKSKYEKETIYLEGQSRKYIKNGEKIKTGWMAKNLEKEFVNVAPETSEELKLFKENKKRAVMLEIIGACVFVGSIFLAPLSASFYGSAVIVSLLFFDVGMAVNDKALKNLSKAVWLRNRDKLLNE